MDELRYPTGPFPGPARLTPDERQARIALLTALPAQLHEAVCNVMDEQLNLPYREGGWTLRQVVHHLADSHIQGYIRCKRALTELEPIISTYEEARWAELSDSQSPITVSLQLLESLHERWGALFAALPAPDFERGFRHPALGWQDPSPNAALVAACVERTETYGRITLDGALALYAWHGQHHVAQIRAFTHRASAQSPSS
jgi:uncharacterized damage-inducible protein DinB